MGDDRELGVARQRVQEAGVIIMVVGQEQVAHTIQGNACFCQVLAVERVIVLIPGIHLQVAALAGQQKDARHAQGDSD